MSHWPSWPLPVKQEYAITPRHTCGYLAERLSVFRAFEGSMETGVSGEEYQKLLDAGFRRSGTVIYQPMCPGCRECVPLRVPVKEFAASKSQRRVLRQNADIVLQVGRPEATREKWELYEHYQRDWHGKPVSETDLAGFVTFLYRSPVETLEFEYRDKWGKLLGVGICDLCPRSLSSVYFYFDPREAWQSLGTYSAMREIAWAREQGLEHWYAGYWIKTCGTMAYKSRFRPCEVLQTDGRWRRLGES